MEDFVRGLPKAELHLHIEGTLEPEMMFELAQRNGVPVRFSSVDEVRAAYAFTDLQSFLDIYYEGASVLITEQDFRDLTWAYLQRASADGVRHVEIFFDPQTHTGRGVDLGVVVGGISSALERGNAELDISSRLIMCFLRHRPQASAMQTLEQALPFKHAIAGVGLDSAERGHPPQDFAAVFARARAEGFEAVAHAGEEGPPEYIWQALDLLSVRRIDHGVRAEEDPRLVERLVRDAVPLTVCPLSNVRLRVFDSMADHNVRRLMQLGLRVTINSDDPAYFGGYVADNYLAIVRAFDLTRDELATVARNSIEATFLPPAEQRALLDELDRYMRSG